MLNLTTDEPQMNTDKHGKRNGRWKMENGKWQMLNLTTDEHPPVQEVPQAAGKRMNANKDNVEC